MRLQAYFVRLGVLLVAVAVGLLGFSASAFAETKTETFSYKDSQQEFVVPAGVTSIHVVATGAAGGAASDGGTAGGRGAVVTGDLSVKPGVLYVEVGGTGDGTGGFNGGGSGGTGGFGKILSGGGGGASDVREVSNGEPNSLPSRLLVAAGGGGGGIFQEQANPACPGGPGGDEEQPGKDGGNCGKAAAFGGGAGKAKEGGAGGAGEPEGTRGTLGVGGNDTPEGNGGGGGGGLYGGGGGGGTHVFAAGAAGGGGGSNLVPEGGTAVLDENGAAPSVVITYTVVKPPTAKIEKPETGGTYNPEQFVETEFSCSEGEGGPGLTECKDSQGIGLEFCTPGFCPSNGPNLDSFEAGEPGEHEYAVTARSNDGLKGTAKITYKVAAPPKAKIESPSSGGPYAQGQIVKTTFSCTEGEFGPGLESCKDSNGASGTSGTLNTSTVGEHEYTVTATSKDGQTGSATLKYTVALKLNPGTTSCNSVYFGSGTTVQVPAGGHCTLLAGTKVSGNVQALRPGGVLVDEGAVIGGSLELDNAASIQLYGGGSITGNLVVTGLTGAPAAADNALCATTIHGYTHVFSNSSNSPIDIGDTGACAGKPGLTSTGLMQVDRNAANITIAGNTLGGYLHVWVNESKLTVSTNTASNIQVNNNTGGVGSTLTGNSSLQACELAANSPKIAGTANKAKNADTCNRNA